MDLINRYVYDVTRRLPEQQRTEIDKELRGLIADMLTERGSEAEPAMADVKAVLIELGDPAKLADNYRGSRRYLVGPGYFDKYVSVLKIVMGAVFIGISVALAVSYIFNPPDSLLTALIKYISSVFTAMLQVFAWVTGGFALAEYHHGSGSELTDSKTEWTPESLPDLPVKATLIPRSDALINIGFTVVFMAILNFAPELFGSISFSDGQLSSLTPLFQLDILRSALPAVNVLYALSIVKEGFKLYYGKWTRNLAIGNILLNIVTIAVTALLFYPSAAIWNPDMSSVMYNIIPRFFVYALGFGLVMDSIVSFFKATRVTSRG